MAMGKELVISILETWGDPCFVGLTGFEVMDEAGRPISLDASCVDADPKEMNDLLGTANDAALVANLLDGVNCTVDDSHMWLAPLARTLEKGRGGGQANVIRIHLGGC